MRRLGVFALWVAATLLPLFGTRSLQAQGVTCPADVLLVMGAAQYNGAPSPAFARRLDKALKLYQAGCADTVVVTGGKQEGDRYTEGEAGARYLMGAGVPERAIRQENESRSSYQNLAFSRPFVAHKRLVIVTDDLHAPRAVMLARHLGYNASVAAVQTHGPRLRYRLREMAGVTAYLFGLYR